MSEKSTEVSRPTVMVVEDFDDTRFLIRFSLQRLGFRVVEAVNGRDAVELARRRCPDLVLMDLGLPVLDGIAATRLMREMEEMCGVPIVA
ncbi:MAG: response regulator, partial [Pyrinomonadaceae bacterium]